MRTTDPIRCADVTQELAAPSGRFRPELLDGHLDDCAACSTFARHAKRLDDLWASSRPTVPAEAFGAIWSAIERDAATEQRGRKAVLPMASPASRPNHWRRGAIAGLLLAQAAAVAAILLTIAHQPGDVAGPGPGGDFVATGPLHELGTDLSSFGKDPVEIEAWELVVFKIRSTQFGKPHTAVLRFENDDFLISETEPISGDTPLFAFAETKGAL